jgi:PAS domain S-box-containing protein
MKKLEFLFLASESPELKELQNHIRSQSVSFTSKEADRKPTIKKILPESDWDIIFIDGASVSFKVFDILQLVKANVPDVPVILFFDSLLEDLVVKSMKMGASDLVLKNNLSRLIPAIHNCLRKSVTESSLKKAKGMFAKYDFNFNTTNSFLSLIDKNYCYQAVNDVFRKLHNLSKDEIIGKYLGEVWGEDKFKKFIKPNLDKCFSNNKITYDAWFSTPTLGMRCFKVRYLPYRNDEGKITHTIIETKDITSERNMTERITRGERESLSIIEFSQDYFWSVDKDLRLIYANKIFKELYYKLYKRKLKEDEQFLKFHSKQEVSVWTKRYQHCLNGKNLSFEEHFLSGSKSGTYFDITITPVKGSDHEIIGLTCLARDISKRKLIEEKNRRQKEDLNLFNKLNAAVNSGKSYRNILGIITRETSKMFGGFGGAIYYLDENGSFLKSRGRLPLPMDIRKKLESLIKMELYDTRIYLNGNSHYQTVLRDRIPVLLNTEKGISGFFSQFHYPGVPDQFWKEVNDFLKIRSVYSIPLVAGEKFLGVFDIYNQSFFSKQELIRIRYIAEQISSILKKKSDEEDLKESENKFRHLFETANDAILIIDDRIFVDCNQKTLDMFRCQRSDIIGKTPMDFSPEFQPGGRLSSEEATKYISSVSRGINVRFEWLHKRLDKSEFYAEISLNQIILGDKLYIQVYIRDISINKFSEQLLKESEQRFRAIFEDAPDAMLLAAPETGFILNSNRKASHLIGKPKEEIIGNHFTFMHAKDQQEMAEDIFYNHLWNNKFSLKNLLYVVNEKGHKTPVEIQGDMITYGGRRVLQGAFRDISEQVNSQQIIKTQANDLSLINHLNILANQNQSLDIILEYFSKQMEEKFGISRFRLMQWDTEKKCFFFRYFAFPESKKKQLKELLRTNIDEFRFCPTDSSMFLKKFNTGEPWFIYNDLQINRQISEVFQLPLNSGQADKIRSFFKVNSLLNFPLLAGRERFGHVVFASEKMVSEENKRRLNEIIENLSGILRRKRAEEGQSKLNSVIEQSSELVIISDISGIIQYVNPAFVKRTGYSQEAILGTNCINNWFEDRPDLKNDIKETLLKGQVWHGRLPIFTKSGQFHDGETNITPVRDENGEIINYAIMQRDISRETQLEAQLRQSQKLETVGTLAGGIAHDFNNILGTVIGYTDMMKEEIPRDSQIQNYVSSIDKALLRAKGLVNQILTFSRKVKPESRLIDLKGLIEDSVDLFSLSLSPNIKLRKDLCNTCDEVRLDPSQIQQVIMNLLTNAVQALKNNEDGLIDIRFSLIENNKQIMAAHENLIAKRLIKLSVSDNGPGISKDVIGRIFEPFFTTKSVNEGTGLGLSVVHGIITGHNGIIEVDSHEGKGTCFTVYLPVI